MLVDCDTTLAVINLGVVADGLAAVCATAAVFAAAFFFFFFFDCAAGVWDGVFVVVARTMPPNKARLTAITVKLGEKRIFIGGGKH